MTSSLPKLIGLVCLVGPLACAPPVPDSVQSEFSMSRDALAFENFAKGFSDSRLDADGMQRMFGRENVCVGSGTGCVLSPAARQWMKRANEAMKAGRCEGFAVLAPLFHKGDLSPRDFGAPEARLLKLRGNTALQKEIAYWFSTQMVPEVVGERSQTFDAKSVMPFLATALKDPSEHYRLGIVKMEGSKVVGGHALTPIGYTKGDDDGVYLLSVYDNNVPSEARVLTIDTKRNRWEYEASRNPAEKSTLFFGDESNGNPLYFAPVRNRVGVLPCRFCQPRQGVEVVTSGPAEVTVKDEQSGAVTGVSGGKPVTGEGGQVSPTFTGLESDPPGFIITNPAVTGAFSVSVSREANEESTQRSGVTAFGDGFVVAVDGLSSRSTGTDTLAVVSGGTRFAVDNATRSSMALDTAIKTTSGKTVEVSASIAGGSSRVETGIDPASGSVSVATAGSSGAEVTVAVTTTDPMTGASSSGEVTFTASGSSTLSVMPPEPGVDGGTLTGVIVDDNASMRPVADGCTDGRRSGSESDVDCGGACTARCALARSCNTGADCASTLCHETSRVCVGSTCENGVLDAQETDVDCGGPSCGRCSVGRACDADADCGSSACVANRCVTTFAISGSLSGLPSGEQVRIRNNGADELTLSVNGGFTFPRRVPGAFEVTITQQPANALCTVARGTGVATEDVSDVRISCQRLFAIGGALTGLPAGSSVTLTNNGGDALTLSADGTFSFAARVTGAFLVEVATQPAGGECSVSNGAGTATGPVTSVQVTCVAGFRISGSASGLPAGESVVLSSGRSGGTTTVSANGSFTLSSRISGPYQIGIDQQPATALCVLSNGTGVATADVTNLVLTCQPTFALGGVVAGLPFGSLELVDEISSARVTVTANGTFSFGRRPGGPYVVAVVSEPPNVRCTVTNGSGTVAGDVSNVQVTCQELYSVGGSVSGLASAFVTLSLSSPLGSEPLVLGNGPFTFTTLTPGPYSVAITAQPVGGFCTVMNGSGTASQNVTSVSVTCEMGFFIGGTLANLPAGDGVTLVQGSTGETRALSSNGSFTFSQRATAYSVAVQTQPQGARCSVANGSGTASANVTNVAVNCIKSGTLDTSFNGNGFMRYAPTGWHNEWLAGVMNPDGTIVAVGREQNIQFDEEWTVNKINPNGGFDNTFGPNGNGELRINGIAGVQAQAQEENARRIFRLSDGSYLIGGLVRNVTVDMSVAKVTPNGRLDTTWGASLPDGGFRGQVTIDVANRQEFTKDMALMPDGRMILVGNVGRFADADIFVTRLLPSGAVDTTFATAGHFLAGTPTVEDMPLSVTLTPFGDIVLAGVSGPDSMLLKLNSAGVPDTSFGPGGMLVVDHGAGLNDRFNAITLTANNELVAAGVRSTASSGNDFLFVRRTLSGALVTSFGTGGVATFDRASRNDIAFVVRELPSGLLLYGGHSSQFAHIGRLTPNGVPDVFFGVGGTASFENNFGGGAVVSDLVFDAQERIYGIGNFGISNPDMGICRVHP